MRLLLVNPRFPESFWSFKWAIDTVLPGTRALNPPLGLATVAALCPDDWNVTIVDENLESIPSAPRADIVGICGMGVQFERQRELLNYYRKKGRARPSTRGRGSAPTSQRGTPNRSTRNAGPWPWRIHRCPGSTC